MLHRCATSSLLGLAAAGLLLGCGVTDPSGGLPPGDAQLAVLNALPEGTVTRLLLDDEDMTLPPSGTRISRVIPAGTHRLEARGGGGRVMGSRQFTVAVGGRRTAVIGGSLVGGGAVIVAGDTVTAPLAPMVKVRVVNTVRETPDLEAWIAPQIDADQLGAQLVSPLDYGVSLEGRFPSFVSRSTGHYLVRVTDVAQRQVQAERAVELVGGEVWSVVLIRAADGELALVPIREATAD